MPEHSDGGTTMMHMTPVLLVLLLAFSNAAAVDTGSAAYNTGRIAGYVFMAVLVVLVIRKLFKR